MRLFKVIKDTYKKSEAAVIAQNLLTIFSKNHMFSGDPAQVANRIIGEVWGEIPNILNGESGARPHKFTVAALAFANAIKMSDARFPSSDSHIYALCIGKIMMEIEENGHKYPLSMLDHNLLARSTEAYIEFTESSSSTPLARDVSKILEKSEPDAGTQRRRNPSEGLRFFNSMHRVDDAYLNDILGIATPTGEAADDMHRMCEIVESAVAPLQMMAMLSGGSGSPRNEETVGYLFGWFDVFKTHIWRVSDFNRSFFHYGFCLWFNDQNGANSEARMKAAMDAMTCLGTNTTSPQKNWISSAQRGADEARAFLRNNAPPRGPHGPQV